MYQRFRKYLPLIVILVGMAIVYFTGIYRYLSFNALRADHHQLKMFVQKSPFLVPFLFCLVYIAATALSIPGAVFLTLLGGYLFPQPLSTLYVVCSATCGATLLFLAARTALGDILRKKAGPFLKKMERGFQENAISYLLFLRFIPIFPFWLVNLAAAFFEVSLFPFIWTTLIGIIPGTVVFTLAGAGLDRILENQEPFSLMAIFNTQICIALVLLGILALLPIILKKLKIFSNG